MRFNDLAKISDKEKTAISMRDGVQEYLGAEIGAEPADKIFLIYRSSNTIKEAANKLKGLAVTDEHIEINGDVPSDLKIGEIIDSELIEVVDKNINQKVAVKNKLSIIEKAEQLIKDGKNELSLGYEADLIESDNYDFEQVNIEPHHLAILKAGRCGSVCSFSDKKGGKMSEFFTDEGGNLSLSNIAKMAAELPDIAGQMSPEQLQELGEMLMKMKQAVGADEAVEDVETEDMKAEDSEAEDVKTEDAGGNFKGGKREKGEEEKPKDEKGFSDASFKDAMKQGALEMAQVIVQTKGLLPDSFNIENKTPCEIRRAAANNIFGDGAIEDVELKAAIALAVKQKDLQLYSKFGDSQTKTLAQEIGDKEL